MKTLPAVAFALSLAALAGSAAPTITVADDNTQAARSCFRLSQIRGQRPDGDERLYLRTGASDVFRIDFKGRCTGLATNTDGLIMTPTGGNDMICSPLSLDIKARNGSFASPCLIDKITRISPEEVAALPPKVKP